MGIDAARFLPSPKLSHPLLVPSLPLIPLETASGEIKHTKYTFFFFPLIKGEFGSPWDQLTAWISKKRGGTAELSWVLQQLQGYGFNLSLGHCRKKKKRIVLGVAYIIYPLQDIKHWEVREHERHSVNDAALISVSGGVFSHFARSVSCWTNKSEAYINILPFPYAGRMCFLMHKIKLFSCAQTKHIPPPPPQQTTLWYSCTIISNRVGNTTY